MKCFNCQSDVPEGAKLCTNCGSALPAGDPDAVANSQSEPINTDTEPVQVKGPENMAQDAVPTAGAMPVQGVNPPAQGGSQQGYNQQYGGPPQGANYQYGEPLPGSKGGSAPPPARQNGGKIALYILLGVVLGALIVGGIIFIPRWLIGGRADSTETSSAPAIKASQPVAAESSGMPAETTASPNTEAPSETAASTTTSDPANPTETTQTTASAVVKGVVQGEVVDAKTGMLIQNFRIKGESDSGEKITENGSLGIFDFPINPGSWSFTVEADNYISFKIAQIYIDSGVTFHPGETIELVPATSGYPGTVEGSVFDALYNSTISGAKVRVFDVNDDFNPVDGANTESDEDGNFSVVVDPGNYVIVVSDQYHHEETFSVAVVSEETKSGMDYYLAPKVDEGEALVALTWAEKPDDLDLHMRTVEPNGDRPHLHQKDDSFYYSAKSVPELKDTDYYMLGDEKEKFGPEIMVLKKIKPGQKYRFYVHNMSEAGLDDSYTMASSGATITVHTSEGFKDISIEYNPGTVWYAFDYQDGEITTVNRMSNAQSSDLVGAEDE